MCYEQYRIKRLLDLTLSITGIAILLPIGLFIYLFFMLNRHSHIILKQERLGRGLEKIVIYKFTTLPPESASNLTFQHGISKFERFLRRTGLDELPQLWNIVKGDMSFVGPRPLLASEVPEIATRLKASSVAKPGLTGLAQLYCGKWESYTHKINYDIIYTNNQRLSLDLKVIFLSVLISFKQGWDSLATPTQNNRVLLRVFLPREIELIAHLR